MNIEEFRMHCLSQNGVEECFPFDQTTLVFKVGEKIFALTDLKEDFAINLKCDPEKAIELREKFPCVQPGYHMNKKHWITIYVDGSMSNNQLRDLIDESYLLIVKKLSKKCKN